MDINKLRNTLSNEVFDEVDELLKYFNINTPERLSHFLGQVSHESGNFKWKSENLNYSKEALMSVFRKYFPTEELASQYARKPEMIANLVYGNRMGNGNAESGEGWKYRGRGFIQLTGKNNYTKFYDHLNTLEFDDDVLDNPDLVSEKFPMLSAAWFWDSNNISDIADEGMNDEVIKKITRRINGGFNGLDDRIKKTKMYYNLLNS